MESRGYYVWKLLKVYLLSGIIYLLLVNLMKDDKDLAFILAMAPFGINLVNSIIPFGFVGNFGAVFMLWAFKLIFAGLIGIIACPITTIYYFVKIVRAQK